MVFFTEGQERGAPQAYCAFGRKEVPCPCSLNKMLRKRGRAPGKPDERVLPSEAGGQAVMSRARVRILDFPGHPQPLVDVFQLLTKCLQPSKNVKSILSSEELGHLTLSCRRDQSKCRNCPRRDWGPAQRHFGRAQEHVLGSSELDLEAAPRAGQPFPPQTLRDTEFTGHLAGGHKQLSQTFQAKFISLLRP